jgi:LPXTG-motif cell wall-anchored protein
MSAGAMADTVSSLGTNPTSGAGAFANTDPGTGAGGSGAFADIYKFDLVGAQILTIAFATNTFASGDPQFITNFQGAVVNDGADNAPGGGDDFVVLGPELAVACNAIPNCQVFGGSAVLGGGHYYLLITGNAGVDAGYGGNLSTSAETPLPAAVWLFGSVLGGGGLLLRRRKKQAALVAA